MAAALLLAGCGHGAGTHGPLRADFDYVWTFGLPVRANEDATFAFAVVHDTSTEPLTITGARPIEPSGSYALLSSFVLTGANLIGGPLVQPPTAAHALPVPHTITKSDGRVEVAFDMHFRPPFTDVRFHGVEVDYRVGARAMKTIFPVTVHLCVHRVTTCSSPSISSAVKP